MVLIIYGSLPSSKRLMYVQFTSCVYRLNFESFSHYHFLFETWLLRCYSMLTGCELKPAVEGYLKVRNGHFRVLFKLNEHYLKYLKWNGQETSTEAWICRKVGGLLSTSLRRNWMIYRCFPKCVGNCRKPFPKQLSRAPSMFWKTDQ